MMERNSDIDKWGEEEKNGVVVERVREKRKRNREGEKKRKTTRKSEGKKYRETKKEAGVRKRN